MVKILQISKGLLFKVQPNVSLSEELSYITLLQPLKALMEKGIYKYFYLHSYMLWILKESDQEVVE